MTRGQREILRNVTWSIRRGECAAIIGPNGSGKSTLVRLIMGQFWPSAGSVQVLGQAFGETDLAELRKDIRLVQAMPVVEFDPDEPVWRIVLTGFFGTIGLFSESTAAMRRRANLLIRRVGLENQALQPYRSLSSGERIRCLIARALVVQPKLLILDEPTAGLDLPARERVLATVQQLATQGRARPTILLITHHVEELLPQTTEVLVLKDGQAAASGPPGKVLTSKILSTVFECPVKVTRHGGRFWWRVQPAALTKVSMTF